MSEHLIFIDISSDYPEKKTKTVVVRTRRSANMLGTIKWFANWRKYTFVPEPDTLYDSNCLHDIAEQCGLLTTERKLERAREVRRAKAAVATP